MKTKILLGKPVADAYREQIAKKITNKKKQGKSTTLAIILVGNDGASCAYLKRIVKLTESLGGIAKTFIFPDKVEQSEVVCCIEKLNRDKKIDGIMPLFPMPKQIDDNVIGNAVAPFKDLDCLNSINIGEFYAGRSRWAPATARACLATLKYYDIKLDGKHAVVIGRSNVVGKPVANLLLQENCTVTVCHSHTKNLKERYQKEHCLCH
ncbi:MAG: bifunctional 5,10-methylene-tetrahydrofolate dehydrogenase/5,10-methylene-tetrahydrofolate cyclohydrolase [Acidaminococcaceae bacterium]|nr:bifunctional 5,10-methylene-tetrahydrofolate dehydrogenase/5,10-methylene-tetrahydrofolate cyclohydrolase [Acidaminococcaceae bacterium]